MILIRHLTLLLFLLSHPAVLAAEKGDKVRPNILLVITDDESWLEKSAYGWSKVATPHFDRVAKEGALFRYAYTSAPSCAPSRAALLTGRNFWELEQGAFIQAWLPRKFAVFPKLLSDAGYHTGRIGKGWGPGVFPPEGHGDDVAGKVYNTVKVGKPEKHVSAIDYMANFSQFLDERKEGAPFFCWLGIMEPHGPWAPVNRVKLEKKFGVLADDIAMPGFLEDTPKVRGQRADMYYEVKLADETLGKALAELERRGELDNTIVVVTSDNGTACAGSKASPYDWGVHEPLAVRWPGVVKSGRSVDDFVNFSDLAPTLLEAAGVPVPEAMSGKSLMPILRSPESGRIDPSRDWIATGLEWHGEQPPECLASRTIRDHRFQYLIRFPRNGVPTEEFYDLENDPDHKRNLAGDDAYASRRNGLKERLKDYQMQTGDPRGTGKMELFDATRKFVESRKAAGYKE
ncbi:sulfatase [Luteolibacter sp. SL250]|uniref:sulfatase family protein n=1 Tax=Luteolibacter sp. SL250 TaxID=2995170 RepID=UPI00226E2B40|nr:sulfatase [Luteolibacter sp. SL250]WAC18219.1 sulfatase [Luteolibacter sp. SL250]